MLRASLVLPVARNDGAREVRQRLVGDDGGRISFDQGFGNFFATDVGSGIARRRKNRDTFLHVVRIGGEHVYGLVFEQPERGAAWGFAPESSQRGARNLNYAALLGPLHESLWALAQNWIALGVGDDRRHSTLCQLKRGVRSLQRNTVVAELNQQVARTFDDVTLGMRQRVLQIVVRKVKVAAQAELRQVADELLQMGDKSPQIFAIVVIAVVGVGRGNHVCDAVGRRGAAHGD